jgi:phosphatidate phosphatase LPIN
MLSLIIWRDAYLKDTSRPASPFFEEDEGAKSVDEDVPTAPASPGVTPLDTPTSGAKPPTSSSWTAWWRRSRQVAAKPELKPAATMPVAGQKTMKIKLGDIPPAESAPALPSSPIQLPVPGPKSSADQEKPKHKFIKTLRLTSDQLVRLFLPVLAIG